jgi:pimeloyl-ACP methyl ester carboxylesterase
LIISELQWQRFAPAGGEQVRRKAAAFADVEAQVFARHSLQPRSRALSLDRPRLRIRAIEVGNGEPVLFLHGFSLCTAHWAPVIAQLPTFRCIAIDMPGHGGSDSVDYDGVDLRPWYRDMLAAVLDCLGIDSVHVVGHSQGAMLGLFFALDAPERVRSLVAIGTPAVAFGAPLPSLRILARPGVGQLLLSMPKPDRMYRRILADTLGEHALATMPTALVRATYLGTRRRGFGRTVSTYLREMFQGADELPPRYVLSDDELRRIRQPTAVLCGQDEGHQNIADASKRAALLPHGRFEILPGGHEPWLDDLEACASQISGFLSAVSPPPAPAAHREQGGPSPADRADERADRHGDVPAATGRLRGGRRG